MTGHQCLRCRSVFRSARHSNRTLTTCRRQTYSIATIAPDQPATTSVNSSAPQNLHKSSPKNPKELDIAALLSKPTWSVRSLLPPDPSASSSSSSSTTASTTSSSSSSTPTDNKITPTQLHHLLRLSALPQPTSAGEEATMLRTLETQLHFVRAIQAVDTAGVEPLVTLRDETPDGIQEMTIGLEDPRIREALAAERKVGRMGRVRRLRGKGGEVEDRRSEEEKVWDPLKGAQGRTVGRYFVVESGKGGGSVG